MKLLRTKCLGVVTGTRSNQTEQKIEDMKRNFRLDLGLFVV